MNTPIRIAAVAVTTSAAAVALFVTGCGDNSGGAKPSSSPAAPAPAAPGPAASSSASAASVDGKAITGKFDTTCAKQAGTLALALTDTDNATYGQLSVSATITGADTVQAVGIAGSKGGDAGLPYAIGYGNGLPGGSAKLTKDGNTFKITGEGVGTPDPANPLAGAKSAKFDITFACSTIVGG